MRISYPLCQSSPEEAANVLNPSFSGGFPLDKVAKLLYSCNGLQHLTPTFIWSHHRIQSNSKNDRGIAGLMGKGLWPDDYFYEPIRQISASRLPVGRAHLYFLFH
jgi:hypothetical protein